MSRWYTGFLWYIYSHMVVCLGKIWSTQLNFILFVGSLESAPGWPTRVTLPTWMAETPRRKWKKDLGQGCGQIVANCGRWNRWCFGEGLTLGGIGAGSPQMIINSYNISKNMEFLKSSYFQTVPHNGLGYQLSLIMVSQPNHLLREYFGSIGIILFFAAGLRKSYWSGCMKAATVICQQIFSILALVIFLLKILLKSVSKSFFFCSGVEIRFWSYNFRRRCA